MTFLDIFFIAVALAFDAMAVAAANGAYHHRMKFKKAFLIAFFFGLFQFFMPVLGWLLGTSIDAYVYQIGEGIAFVLLATLGIRMIIESFKEQEQKEVDIHSMKLLLILAFATSIDALVVGLTFVDYTWQTIWLPTGIIGLVTFALSLGAIYAGKKFGKSWGTKAEVVGGLVLILIGVKMLFG